MHNMLSCIDDESAARAAFYVQAGPAQLRQFQEGAYWSCQSGVSSLLIPSQTTLSEDIVCEVAHLIIRIDWCWGW